MIKKTVLKVMNNLKSKLEEPLPGLEFFQSLPFHLRL